MLNFKRYKIGLLFFFLASFVYAQKQEYKTFYFSDGAKSSEGTLVDGKPEGYWKTYFQSGLLKSEGNRENHLLTGEWKFYNKYGDLYRLINYERDKKNGLTYTFNDSCQLIKSEPFLDDVLDGKVTDYYPTNDSLVWKTTPYVQGILDGRALEYARDGRIITIANYNHGFIKNKEKVNRKNLLGKQGVWKEFYPDGKLKVESRYKNDVLNGYVKKYDKKGILIEAILYVNGVIHQEPGDLFDLTVRKEYYDDGTVKTEGTYDGQGQKQGLHTSYDPSGKIESAVVYSNDVVFESGDLNEKGERKGSWEFYYPDGKIRAKGKYKAGKKIGNWDYFFENGRVEQKGRYNKEGKAHGDWVWFYEDGQILREESFWRGREDGKMKEFSDSATVITEGEYIDGNKEGPWYYIMGDHKEEGKYRAGERDGEWNHYFPNGKLSFRGSYVDGAPEGKHLYYYKTGRLKREEHFEFGLQHGIWKTYNEQGIVVLVVEYKKGVEFKINNRRVR